MPAAGSRKFTRPEIDRLLQCVDAVKPVNQEGWVPVSTAYNADREANDEPRDAHSLWNKFSKLKNSRFELEDPVIPPEMRRAKLIQRAIEEKKRRGLAVRGHDGLGQNHVNVNDFYVNIPQGLDNVTQLSVSTVSSHGRSRAEARKRSTQADTDKRLVARRLIDMSGAVNAERFGATDTAVLLATERNAYDMLENTAVLLKQLAETLHKTAEALRLAQEARGVTMLAQNRE